MNREMQIILEVNIQAEKFYDQAIRLGEHAAFVLGRDRRSQMTGLENIADSALKKTDIFDFIKRQTARFPFWRQSIPREKQANPTSNAVDDMGFGERLLYYLEQKLVENLDEVCDKERLNIGKQTDDDQYLRRRIYLLLIRQFIHQMVAMYEFQVSMTTQKKGA